MHASKVVSVEYTAFIKGARAIKARATTQTEKYHKTAGQNLNIITEGIWNTFGSTDRFWTTNENIYTYQTKKDGNV